MGAEMGSRPRGALALRSFREGDQVAIARLFNQYLSGFAGPRPMTPEAWRRQFRRRSWNGPSVDEDRDCVRVAERGGEVVGYAVTDYRPFEENTAAIVQELCVAGDRADEVAAALLEDAERRARQRGRQVLAVQLSPDDGLAERVAERLGFRSPGKDAGVFMAAVVDLARLLKELEQELSRRLAQSECAGWTGTLRLRSQGQTGWLRIRAGRVSAPRSPKAARADITAEVHPDALPLLVFGRCSVRWAYLQDMLSVEAADRGEALRLLDALFPRLPIYLPRAQWW